MSLLQRNELRLRVGPMRCEGAVWRGSVQTRCEGRASHDGSGPDAIDGLLDRLEADGHRLPRNASLCVEDELLHYTTAPANGSWAQAHAAAQAWFAAALDLDGLLVETSLAPCGSVWVSVAVEAAEVDAWRAVLAARGVELRHVRAAALEDLAALRQETAGGNAVVALLRQQGATLVTLHGGCIAEIAWERVDPAETALLAARIAGTCRRATHVAVPGDDEVPAAPPVVVAPHDAAQHARLAPLAAERGWRLAAPLTGAGE